MILTCPECATSYFVDDNRIPRRGRSVKCSNCGARWKALPEGEFEDEPVPDLDFVAAEAAAEPPAEEDFEFVAAPVTPLRKPPPPKRSPRGLAIAVLAVGFLAMAGAGLIAFRAQVAALVPASAPVFAAIGMPVNVVGLALEAESKAILIDGRPVLAITGTVRNITKQAITSPPLKITLVGKGETVLATYGLSVTNARVPPGGVRYFAWNVRDPPANAERLQVAFAPAGHGGEAQPAPAAAEQARPAAEHAPAPVEAQPLPANAPDALPHHE